MSTFVAIFAANRSVAATLRRHLSFDFDFDLDLDLDVGRKLVDALRILNRPRRFFAERNLKEAFRRQNVHRQAAMPQRHTQSQLVLAL
jgi:hypothetical protein